MKTTKDNIEVILFDYAEGNLSPEEQKEVEAFLENNPQYKQMLSSYKDCKGLDKPLDVKFEEKDELFTLATGKKAKSIVFVPRYMKYACSIAAMILLFFAIKPLLEKEVVVEEKTPTLIAQKKAKKNSEKAKNYFEKAKKKNEKVKENFYFSIEEEQDTIIHQLAFQKTELASPKIEKKTKFIKQTYKVEREIIIKETPKFIQKAKGIINFAKNLGEEKLIVVEKEFKVKTSKNV
ncbi:MAG: hypothetical protein U0J38_08290 [Bacteroidales bacterium]|nr:hypothetical protein [Bacteroidales bacterium]